MDEKFINEAEQNCESCTCFNVCIIVRYIQKIPLIPIASHLNIEASLGSVRKKFYAVLKESCANYKEKTECI